MYNIEDLTEQARRSGASDIHLVCGLPPKYRLDGQLENTSLKKTESFQGRKTGIS